MAGCSATLWWIMGIALRLNKLSQPVVVSHLKVTITQWMGARFVLNKGFSPSHSRSWGTACLFFPLPLFFSVSVFKAPLLATHHFFFHIWNTLKKKETLKAVGSVNRSEWVRTNLSETVNQKSASTRWRCESQPSSHFVRNHCLKEKWDHDVTCEPFAPPPTSFLSVKIFNV